MSRGNKSRFTTVNSMGFTLLEVTLFLAISGGLAVIAFAGLAPRLRNVRFSSAVENVSATLKSQFNAASIGSNQHPDNFSCKKTFDSTTGTSYPKVNTDTTSGLIAGGSPECVINGKLVVFEPNRMVFYSIVSLKDPIPETCEATSFTSTRDCFKPRLARGLVVNVYDEPPYQVFTEYQSGVTASRNISGIDKPLAFGYIQDPNGTSKYQFFYTSDNLSQSPNLTDTNTVQDLAQPSVCLKLGNRSAQYTFSATSIEPSLSYEACTV